MYDTDSHLKLPQSGKLPSLSLSLQKEAECLLFDDLNSSYSSWQKFPYLHNQFLIRLQAPLMEFKLSCQTSELNVKFSQYHAEVLEGLSSEDEVEDETLGRIFPRSRTRWGKEFFPFTWLFWGRDEESIKLVLLSSVTANIVAYCCTFTNFTMGKTRETTTAEKQIRLLVMKDVVRC